MVKKTLYGFRVPACRAALWWLLQFPVTCSLFSAFAQLPNFPVARLNNIRFADQFTGSNMGAKINAAIADACNGTAPGKVVLPLGTNTISTTINPVSNCDIGGYGMGITILQTASSSPAGFYPIQQTATSSNILLHDFTVDGNKAAQTNTGQGGIKFDKVSKSTITRVEAKNVVGLAASGIAWTGSDNTLNTDNEVSFCYLHDNGSVGPNNADGLAAGGLRLRFIGNTIQNNSDTGIGLQGNNTDTVLIANNLFSSNVSGTCGWAAGPGSNFHITAIGNLVGCTNGFGVNFQGVAGFQITGGFFSMTAGAGGVEALHIENSTDGRIETDVVGSSGSGGLAADGIIITSTGSGVTGHISVNSNVRLAQKNGLEINATGASSVTQDIEVTGGSYKNNSQATNNTFDGITIGASGGGITRRVTISNCFSGDDSALANHQRYGISAGGTPTVLAISNCVLTGNASSAFGGIPTGSTGFNNTGSGLQMSDTTPVANLSLGGGAGTSVTSNTLTVAASMTGDGGGLKHKRFASPLGGTCPTAASVGATCTSANLTWTTAFADNNYSVSCSLDSVTNQPHIVNVTKLAAGAGITVTIAADTAAAANAGVECAAYHD